MDLADLKRQWNEVLDELERTNRVAWLVFFDARLVQLRDNALAIDFRDRSKLAAGHDFESHISPSHLASLREAILIITGENLEITLPG